MLDTTKAVDCGFGVVFLFWTLLFLGLLYLVDLVVIGADGGAGVVRVGAAPMFICW